MRTSREDLWKKYYAAVKAGRRKEAQALLSQIHNSGPKRSVGAKPGGCSRCKKRFG